MYLGLSSDTTNLFEMCFPEGPRLVFGTLTFQSFLRIRDLMNRCPELLPQLEEAVFLKCLVEPQFLVHEIGHMKAGIITTVANLIYQFSGPQNMDDITQHLNQERIIVQDLTYQAVATICRAFPAYTPDAVLQLSWATLVNRLAMAEAVLLNTGAISEPLEISDTSTRSKQPMLPYAQPQTSRVPVQPVPSKHTRSIQPDEIARDARDMDKAMSMNVFEREEQQLQKQQMLKDALKFHSDLIKKK